MRAEPSGKSEMVSQLLFGDIYSVVNESSDWLLIRTAFDHYTAYININQLSELNIQLQNEMVVENFPFLEAKKDDGSELYIPFGSSIYKSEEFRTISSNIVLNKNVLEMQTLVEKAKNFLNTTYLWGGRTFMGIDCSGFTQVVFKSEGFKLPRDAYQQAEVGQPLSFLEETKEGDLAFFDNEDGKIVHVGIILNDNKIIHASGRVRIDSLDNNGIFNNETNKYSHKLRLIRRVKTV